MLTRREFVALTGGAALSFGLPGCRAAHPPLRGMPFAEVSYRQLPVLGLATSLPEEFSEPAEVEGTLPAELTGTLYRNGPGLFERGGYRKRCLLDGDGMIHAWHFAAGAVHFRNRFVATRKYQEESAAGRFLYPTWSTQAPGGPLANLFPALPNQAGVSVVVRDGRLFAFDDLQPPYELDPSTLETIGLSWLGQPPGSTVFSAHSKLDRQSGDWIFFGLDYGRRCRLYLTILGADERLRKKQVEILPDHFFIHDFFASERHIIVHLHPAEISTLPVLFGLKSITGAMRWRPERGSRVLVFDRFADTPPRCFETEASWMWHALNAYDQGNTLIADFVGFRDPDHFLGADPALFAIMQGRWGNYRSPGELRRYTIDLTAGSLRQEIVAGENHEFPAVNPHHACHRHRVGYLVRISPGALLFDEVVRIDLETGRSNSFRFPEGVCCSEPVFAPLPDYFYRPGGEEPGWLFTEAYDGNRRRSFLAVFRADAVADGPLAQIWLPHHLPLAFHGFWQPA